MAWKQRYSPKDDLKDTNSRQPGLTGLQNLENTCYMNAVLQCLCSLPQLVDYFLSGRWNTALHVEFGESATAFGCLMSDLWLGEFDYVSPEAFHSVFGKRYLTFSTRTQQDAQEFLMCVLEELHQAFRESSGHRASAEASRGSGSGTSIITQLFEGQLSYSITCLKCKTITDRPESFTVLSLPIPSGRVCALEDCLECFFQPDTLTQNNQIHCCWCGTNQDATVKATITRAPQIIIFHLKRFAWQDRHRRKLSTTVCYPFSNLDLSPYSSRFFYKNTAYSLCALVNHTGDIDYGHYTAFCKHSTTRHWYSFDDTQVTKISDSAVQTDTAYLLFYTCQGY